MWIFFVLLGQFLNAIVVIVDKHIVTAKVVSRPIVYTFYVSLLSIIAIFALPFGVSVPSTVTIAASLLGALCYTFSIYLLYKSLQHTDPSDTLPVIGGVSALTTFIASSLLLKEDLPHHFMVGFFVLVLGMVLISHFKFSRRAIYQLFGSGFFFGFSTVLVKLIFSNDTFINGFFWSRMANVLLALLMLLLPGMYKLVMGDEKKTGQTRSKKKRKGYSKVLLILSNKALAGAAFFCILLAIKHGNVSIINALAATQYIFLFIFALIWHKSFPGYFSPELHRHELVHKISATALIVLGFIILFI